MGTIVSIVRDDATVGVASAGMGVRLRINIKVLVISPLTYVLS